MSLSAVSKTLNATRRFLQNDQLILAGLSLGVGLAVAWLVVGLREGIQFFHTTFFGASDERIYYVIAALPWWQIVMVPTLGGLVVVQLPPDILRIGVGLFILWSVLATPPAFMRTHPPIEPGIPNNCEKPHGYSCDEPWQV